MQIISRSCCVAIALALACPVLTLAQTDAKRIIQQAYQKTKSAKAVEDYAAIIDLCQQAQAFELSPANDEYVNQLQAWALNRRGEAFVEQAATLLTTGESQRAAEFDGKALADFEASVKLDAERWKALHNRGVSLALVGKYEAAIADFSSVVELKPDYQNAWFNRAEIQYELGEFQDAAADYTRALELAPTDFGALTGRGHAHFQLQQFAKALVDYSSAIEVATDRSGAYANRGDVYRKLQRWEEAAADFRKAIELDPSSPRGYQGAAWLMATCPEDRFRNAELGLQTAAKAAELAGQQDYQILDTLAAAHANTGDFDQAITAISQAIKLAPAQQATLLAQRLELYNAGTPFREPLTRTAQAEDNGQATR